jgi:hypothetical protein
VVGRAAMEILVLAFVALSPWCYGAHHPNLEFRLVVGPVDSPPTLQWN